MFMMMMSLKTVKLESNKTNDKKCRNLRQKISKWQLFPTAPISPTATDANQTIL